MSANEEIVKPSRLSGEGMITPKNHNSSTVIQIDEKDEKEVQELTKELDPIHEKIINDQIHIEDDKSSYWQLYSFATKRDWILMGIGLIFAFAAGAAIPAIAPVFEKMVDYLTKYQNKQITEEEFLDNINYFVLFFVYLAILALVSNYFLMACWAATGERITRKIRENYLHAVLRQNIAYFDKLGAGEVTTRITNDTHLIQNGISEKVSMSFSHLAQFVIAFAIAFSKSWKMTLVICGLFPLITINGSIFNKFIAKYKVKILDYCSQAAVIAEETFSTIRTSIAFSQQKNLSKNYDAKLEKAKSIGVKTSALNGLCLGTINFFVYLTYALAFWYGSTLIISGELTPGTVVNVFFSVLIGSYALGNVMPDIVSFNTAQVAGKKIFETINRIPPIDIESKEGNELDQIEGRIQLKNISFIYPSRPEIKTLKNVSLDIEPGTTVALVGSSGSGKSTIVSLILRFYDPIEGEILVDGHDIKGFNLKWLRRQMSLVSQEPVLFNTSIAENVSHGLIGSAYENVDPDKKHEMIVQACKMANAHDFIMKLPDKYETNVGERGFLLSGGQKQRIAIARAIVKDPKILLLDEATSALDTKSEGIVQDALDKASKNRTTVVIAHRLSTIRNATKIVVMSNGEIVETGTHNELIQEQEGPYSKLVAAQKIQQQNEEKSNKDISEEGIALSKVISNKSIMSTKSSCIVNELNDIEKGANLDYQYTTWELIKKVAKINRPEWYLMIMGFFASIVSGMTYPLFAFIYGKVINSFSKPVVELREDATFCFFDEEKNNAGSLTSALSTSATEISGLAGATLGIILQIISTLISGTIVALIIGWKLALISMTMIPFLMLGGFYRIKMMSGFQAKTLKAHERSAQVACEGTANIRTVASLTRENDILKLYSQMLDEPLKEGYKNAIFGSMTFALTSCTNYLVEAMIFWYGAHLFVYGEYNLFKFFTVFMAVIFGAISSGRIFAYATNITRAKISAESLISLIESLPSIDTWSHNGKKIDVAKGHIKFSKVHFNYPTRPDVPVLRGLNLEIKPGQFAALVGPSGCGKSTIIGLTERFYDVSSGSVELDGNDLKTLNINNLREHISLVSQEPSLYNMTIKENIIFGCKPNQKPTQEDIERVCNEANIHEFIISLPNGYDTHVGNKGSQLSGGQKQRIAIARALIRNPKILLLDEATSALDTESEKIVQKALDKASEGRTTLAIAHRLSTIQHADIIFVIKDGKVAEEGTHQELLAKKGIYHMMVQEQK
ncbi:151_t:CDS:2 [Funneliformis mosseae]|uniref:151_t:CDS:1 n=1 Tax=Funneliformis mosseae TaxID=27381 RepID=A0A9N8VB61_FUNMO|nr:151_t:CDS:2 [Funneliformis mosseae]